MSMIPSRARRWRRSLAGLAALSAVSLVAASCGDDGSSSDSTAAPATAAPTTAAPATPAPTTTAPTTAAPTTAAPTTAAPTTAAPTTTAAPSFNDVDVELLEYSITMPDSIPSGPTRLVTTNSGVVEHHLIMARAHDGVKIEDVLATFATDENAAQQMVDLYPGPNGIGPGATQTVALDLPAGDYLALCVIPDADGVPHAAHGMFKIVTVTDSGAPAADLPHEGGSISLTDYTFTVSDDFTGQGHVLVTNDGQQGHEMPLYKIGEGGSLEDFMARISDPAMNPAEFYAIYTPAGGLAPMAPGLSAAIELDLESGAQYIAICFVPDTGDSLPHFLHDMIKVITVP